MLHQGYNPLLTEGKTWSAVHIMYFEDDNRYFKTHQLITATLTGEKISALLRRGPGGEERGCREWKPNRKRLINVIEAAETDFPLLFLWER